MILRQVTGMRLLQISTFLCFVHGVYLASAFTARERQQLRISSHRRLFDSKNDDVVAEADPCSNLCSSSTCVSRSSFLSLSVAAALLAATPMPATASMTPEPATAKSQDESILLQTKQKRDKERLEESISGFVSGAALTVSKTVVKYPLDSASVRLQMPGTKYSISNLPELFNGSYRGILAPLLSNIPAGAVFFAVKDSAKSILKEQGTMPKWLSTSLAVLAAQGPYWALRNPSEVVKTRQQAGVEGYGEGVNIVDAFKLATQKESGDGIRELYSGYWENIIYAYPADVIKFVCYESLSGGRKDLSPAKGAVYGAASTAIAQLVTTPLDVVRNRIMAGEGKTQNEKQQSSSTSASKSSYIDKLTTLAKEEGLEGLFAGASPRVGKALLSGAIQFATYEETKQSINRFLENKLK